MFVLIDPKERFKLHVAIATPRFLFICNAYLQNSQRKKLRFHNQMELTVKSKIRILPFKYNYPKVEYLTGDIFKDTSIIRNLIFAIQQVTIMQIIADSKLNTHRL